MKLIAFVGMPASGKSEASNVAKRLGIPVVSMGDAVREEAAKLGLSLTDENVGGTGTALRKKEGMDAVARRCVPKIHSLKAPLAVVDGIRNIEEINYFKKQFGRDFKLIAIHSPLELRFERIKKRLRQDDMSSIKELEKRDKREAGWGLLEAIEIADIKIENTGSLEKFKKRVEELLGNL